MDTIKAIWNWIIYSSADPEKFSLTLKAVVPFLVLFKIGDQVTIDGFVGIIAHLVIITVTWITGAIATFGALRKVWYSMYPKAI